MKMTIQRHEELLKASEASRQRQIEHVEGLVAALSAWSERNRFRADQIARARLLGKTEFDDERFMVKRNKL